MKTETKVDIVDYLELYEFKKAYDEGKRVIVKINYGGLDRTYMVPKEELTAEMQAFISEYDIKSQNWQSEEEAQGYIDRLDREIKDHKSEKIRRDEYIHTLEREARKKVEADESKISSLKFRIQILGIALVATLVSLAISIFA